MHLYLQVFLLLMQVKGCQNWSVTWLWSEFFKCGTGPNSDFSQGINHGLIEK